MYGRRSAGVDIPSNGFICGAKHRFQANARALKLKSKKVRDLTRTHTHSHTHSHTFGYLALERADKCSLHHSLV